MSNQNIVQDLTCLAIQAMELSHNLIQNENFDLGVTKLESLLDAIQLVNESHEIPWALQVCSLIRRSIDFLLENLDNNPSPRQGVGRPKIQIPSAQIEGLLGMRFSVPTIARMLGVSKETIFRRMKEAQLSVGATYTLISDPDLDRIILEILLNHPNTGYKRMKGFLQERNIRVTDSRVRMSMREVDPDGVYQRTLQNRAIVRRQYHVDYSNQMWHLDTNMKLIRWGIIVRSCVDGKSRTALYIHASADNRAVTNFLAFLTGVEQYGIPLRTRSDKGGENVLIAKYMIETRGTGRGSHIAGRSVHNQRIERFWKDVFYGVLSFYYSVFSKLEDDNMLDIENPLHVAILHRIFIPRLCRHLITFMNAWNLHPLSTEGNYTPHQLMFMHLPPPEFDMTLSETDLEALHFICNGPEELQMFDQEDSITTPISIPAELPTPVTTYLESLEPTQSTESYGYDLFQFAVNLLA